MRFTRAMWFPSPLDPLRKSTAWLWLNLPTWWRYCEPSWLKARLTACPGGHHRTATCCQAYTLEISDRTQQNTKPIQDQKVLFCLTQKLQAFLGWSIQTQEGLVKYSFTSPKRQMCFGIIVSSVEFKKPHAYLKPQVGQIFWIPSPEHFTKLPPRVRVDTCNHHQRGGSCDVAGYDRFFPLTYPTTVYLDNGGIMPQNPGSVDYPSKWLACSFRTHSCYFGSESLAGPHGMGNSRSILHILLSFFLILVLEAGIHENTRMQAEHLNCGEDQGPAFFVVQIQRRLHCMEPSPGAAPRCRILRGKPLHHCLSLLLTKLIKRPIQVLSWIWDVCHKPVLLALLLRRLIQAGHRPIEDLRTSPNCAPTMNRWTKPWINELSAMAGTKPDQPASLESPYKNSSSMPSLDGLGGNWPTFELERKKDEKRESFGIFNWEIIF